jgi:hypothetical protein
VREFILDTISLVGSALIVIILIPIALLLLPFAAFQTAKEIIQALTRKAST